MADIAVIEHDELLGMLKDAYRNTYHSDKFSSGTSPFSSLSEFHQRELLHRIAAYDVVRWLRGYGYRLPDLDGLTGELAEYKPFLDKARGAVEVSFPLLSEIFPVEPVKTN